VRVGLSSAHLAAPAALGIGPNLKVIASCSEGVAFSDEAYDVKISGENNITLSTKQPVPMEMPYVRCGM